MIFSCQFILLLIKTLCNQGLVEFIHFSFHNFFLYKNVAISLLIPLLELEFNVFESFLKKEHSCALNIQIFCPRDSNVVIEVWVGEPDILKSERPVVRFANTLNVQLNRPVIQASKEKNTRNYVLVLDHKIF